MTSNAGLPAPYYQDNHCTIYHGDAREILPHLPKVDLVLTDPPYGIGWKPRVNHRGADRLWDDSERFDPGPWLTVGNKHVFWGAQYYTDKLPVSEAWFCWVKRTIAANADFSEDKRTYSTIELAWSDIDTKPCFKSIVWDGGKRAGDPQNRTFCHPSQKPLELMKWCIVKAGDPQTILDPFMGSGTTLRAAKDLGRKAIGIEIEEKYCEIAARRMSQEVLF